MPARTDTETPVISWFIAYLMLCCSPESPVCYAVPEQSLICLTGLFNGGQAQASEHQPCCTTTLGICNFLALRLCFTFWISDFAPFRCFWLINHGCRVLLQAACYNIWLITSPDLGIVVQWARSHLAMHDSYSFTIHALFYFYFFALEFWHLGCLGSEWSS